MKGNIGSVIDLPLRINLQTTHGLASVPLDSSRQQASWVKCVQEKKTFHNANNRGIIHALTAPNLSFFDKHGLPWTWKMSS